MLLDDTNANMYVLMPLVFNFGRVNILRGCSFGSGILHLQGAESFLNQVGFLFQIFIGNI